MLCDREGWRRDSPVCPLAGSCKELSVPNTLKVEPQRLIERQGKLIRRVVALSLNFGIQSKVKLLDGSAELSP